VNESKFSMFFRQNGSYTSDYYDFSSSRRWAPIFANVSTKVDRVSAGASGECNTGSALHRSSQSVGVIFTVTTSVLFSLFATANNDSLLTAPMTRITLSDLSRPRHMIGSVHGLV
jgi:hypothetical protein